MTAFTIQDVSRRSGLSEPTLRYYEEVGLIGPIDRDGSSGYRRYSSEDVDALQMLACLRAMGMGIEDMRTYQANRARGRAAAAEQRDLLLRHAERVEAQIETLRTHLDYLRDKAAVWVTTTTNCGGTTRSCAGHMASSLVSVSLTSVAGAGRRPVRSRAWPRQAVRSG